MLAAGTYTFFAIPIEAEWTAIFNRVPRQWGAFVKPAEGAHQEYLGYTVQPRGANAAVVMLAWEKRSIAFPRRCGSLAPAKPCHSMLRLPFCQ